MMTSVTRPIGPTKTTVYKTKTKTTAFKTKTKTKTDFFGLRPVLSSDRRSETTSLVWIQYTNVTDGQTDGHGPTAKTALTHDVER